MSMKRLAIISDIHGNHIALAEVMRHVEKTGVDGIVFMGDYVSDFPGGHRVIEALRKYMREYPTWIIKGNREDYMLRRRRGKLPYWGPGSAFGSLYYAYNDLAEDDLDFFEGMDYMTVVATEGAEPFTACHASPRACRDSIIHDDRAIEECLGMVRTRLMLCGHAHLVRTYCGRQKRAEFVGSVGLPNGAGGCAQFAYAAWDRGGWNVDHVTMPYDVEAALKECRDSGLAEMGGVWTLGVIAMARTGIDMPSALMAGAAELAGAEGAGKPIPEDIWQRAARRLGIIP